MIDEMAERMREDDMRHLAPHLNISKREFNQMYAKYTLQLERATEELKRLKEKYSLETMAKHSPERDLEELIRREIERRGRMNPLCADVTFVNRKILKTWLKKQGSREEAYILMGEALIDSGLRLVAAEVLNYPCSLYYRALTDDLVEQIAKELSKEDMRRLALELGITLDEVDAIFARYCSDNISANKNLLSTWLNRQNSREEAFCKLVSALMHPDVGLNLLATEALGYFSKTNK